MSEYEKLRTLVDALVNQYFAAFSASSKKAELAEMQRLGISTQSYNAFLKGKRESKKPAELCYGLRNPDWLIKLATDQGLAESLSALMSSTEAAEKASKIAYSQIVRKPIV